METSTLLELQVQPRAVVLAQKPYSPPLGARRGKTRLDFNENTVGFPWAYAKGAVADDYTTYPEYEALIVTLAAHLGVAPEALMLTNGSDEALMVLPNTFIEPKVSKALCCQPTFPIVPHYLTLAEAQLTQISLNADLTYPLEAIGAALQAAQASGEPYRLVVLANPDNPTGATLPKEQVLAWCQQHPHTLFVVDEAYVQFMPQGSSVLPQVAHTPNLVVTQTFSKVWGLAGLRLGYVVGHPQVIDWLKRVRSPYSVNTHAVQCALALLEKAPLVQQATQEAMERKASLIAALESRGLQVKSQAANFFLLNLGLNAEPFGRFAAQHGVLVRSMAGRGPLLEGLVRISVGTEGEHQLLLQVLDAFFERSALVFDLDDTLIDTTQSFDAVVALLVRRHSDVPLGLQELHNLRAEGGFNDDWDATVALLARRGKTLSYDEVKAEGQALYLKMASAVEEWRLPSEHLQALAQRYRLFLFTGRARVELDTIWGEALSPLFEAIYCSDDIAGLAKKPAPDYLHHITQTHGLHAPTCWYVGNSVDDMAAANAAGYQALGVVTTFSEAALQQAGAAVTLPCPQHLLESFACPPLPTTHV